MERIDLLRADAEAEDFARSMCLKPNPWSGAQERLSEFEQQAALEKAIAEREAAAIETSARYTAFQQAVATRTSLRADIFAANDRAREILEQMQSADFAEAQETTAAYNRWRLDNLAAGEAEMIFRALGAYPPHHFLHGVRPELLAKMRDLAQLRKEHERELRLAANWQDALNALEAQWPALRAMSLEAVA